MSKSRPRRRPTPRPANRPQGRSTPKPPPARVVPPGLRGRVETASTPILRWLSARPRFLVPVTSVVLLVLGLAAPTPLGVPVLLVLLALLGWLSFLSWPVVVGVPRLLRLGVIGLLLAAVLGRLSA